MNTPIEDQLRDYFTMVDRMQGTVDTTPQTPDVPTLGLVNDTNHDTNEWTTEVTMLSPDRNEPRNRSRTWLAVAASVAAVALVGGLIVVANRDTDDNVPADQPAVTVTVPDTTGVDAETAPAPDGESSDAAVDPAVEQATETLPPIDVQTRGILKTTCEIGVLTGDPNVSMTAPQTCVTDGNPLPVQAREEISLTLFEPSVTPAPGQVFVSSSDDGYLSAGYNYDDGLHVRVIATQPGVGEYEGETIRQLTRGGDGEFVIEWSSDVDDAPLPTTEEGGISAELTITCEAQFVSGTDTEQILDQSCTYTSEDPRFDRAPEVIRSRIFRPASGPTTLAGYPQLITGETDGGALFAGFAENNKSARVVGVRQGTGEFEGMLIHDVAHYNTASDGSVSGTIRSTVYPDE